MITEIANTLKRVYIIKEIISFIDDIRYVHRWKKDDWEIHP